MGQKDRKTENENDRKLPHTALSNLSPSACSSTDTMSLKNTAGICSQRERDGGQRDKHRLVQLFTVSLMIITMTGSHNNN